MKAVIISKLLTASAIAFPIFATIYGLTNEEMPSRNVDIISTKIKGLVPCGHSNMNDEHGYLVFVKGKHKDDIEENIALLKGTIVSQALIKNTRSRVLNYFLEDGYYYTTVERRYLATVIMHALLKKYIGARFL